MCVFIQDILSNNNLYEYAMLVMYKLYTEMLPKPFGKIFTEKSVTSKPLTRQVTPLYVPLCKSQIAHNCITIVGVKIWNDVSSKINIYCSFYVFKSAVKNI